MRMFSISASGASPDHSSKQTRIQFIVTSRFSSSATRSRLEPRSPRPWSSRRHRIRIGRSVCGLRQADARRRPAHRGRRSRFTTPHRIVDARGASVSGGRIGANGPVRDLPPHDLSACIRRFISWSTPRRTRIGQFTVRPGLTVARENHSISTGVGSQSDYTNESITRVS